MTLLKLKKKIKLQKEGVYLKMEGPGCGYTALEKKGGEGGGRRGMREEGRRTFFTLSANLHRFCSRLSFRFSFGVASTTCASSSTISPVLVLAHTKKIIKKKKCFFPHFFFTIFFFVFCVLCVVFCVLCVVCCVCMVDSA